MAFRRQDIPKTTRQTAEGEPRRLYPRYAKDRVLVPKIEVAIGYLDGMVGRRRGDLAPEGMLDLFGDPKLARCLLSCLADTYHYRTPTIAEALGAEAAAAAAMRGLETPMDFRAATYLRTNERASGVVAPATRDGFLAEWAEELGLSASQLDEALHLDAERNAILVRAGDRPRAEDIRARYNALLSLSVLRHASEVEVTLPGLTPAEVEVACERNGVPYRWAEGETVRLSGRRSATGSWAQFGVKLTRCAATLLLLAPPTPTARATVHLNGRPLAFVLDGFALAALRPATRCAAGSEEAALGVALMEAVAALRRKSPAALRGWTIRRATEPLVVEGAIVLPEFVCVRDGVAVALVPVPADRRRPGALAAIARVARVRPVVALGGAEAAVPSLPAPDGEALVAALDGAAGEQAGTRTALGIVEGAVAEAGWLSIARLAELFGAEADLMEKVRPLTRSGRTIWVPGCGLCAPGLVADLADRRRRGPLDIGDLRNAAAAVVGPGPSADALTLYLLTSETQLPEPAALAPSA